MVFGIVCVVGSEILSTTEASQFRQTLKVSIYFKLSAFNTGSISCVSIVMDVLYTVCSPTSTPLMRNRLKSLFQRGCTALRSMCLTGCLASLSWQIPYHR